MPYTLSPRQVQAFTDVVDLYEPVAISLGTSGVLEYGQKFTSTATTSGVQCRITPRREGSEPKIMGRTNYEMLDTTDQLRVHKSEPVGDGWFVQLKTPGHPKYLQWFTVQGEAQTITWRANERVLLLKRSTKGPGVA